MKPEKPIEPDINYVVGGKLMKKLMERKITGKLGEINVIIDKDDNVTLSLANVTRCLLVDSGELRYGWIPIRFEA